MSIGVLFISINYLKHILLYDSLVLTLSNSFLLRLLQADISMFSHIFHSFSKNYIIHQLEKFFFKVIFFFFSSVFISMYGFNQVSWLNLIILCTFSMLLYDLICFCKISCGWHILFPDGSWIQDFQLFQFSFFQAKKSKSLRTSYNFSGYWTSTSRNYPSSLSYTLYILYNVYIIHCSFL